MKNELASIHSLLEQYLGRQEVKVKKLRSLLGYLVQLSGKFQFQGHRNPANDFKNYHSARMHDW